MPERNKRKEKGQDDTGAAENRRERQGKDKAKTKQRQSKDKAKTKQRQGLYFRPAAGIPAMQEQCCGALADRQAVRERCCGVLAGIWIHGVDQMDGAGG